MRKRSNSVAAIVLSGGASTRMGHDKTQVLVGGSTLARRTGTLIRNVVETAIEVGPGVTGLPAIVEEPPRQGPLAAIARGYEWLGRHGQSSSALVLACDLPHLSEELLHFLVAWESLDSVVPVVDGVAQPLCAKWGGRDLADAHQRVRRGDRSLRHLATAPGVVLLDESIWSAVATERQFFDVDTPEDVRRAGLSLPEG